MAEGTLRVPGRLIAPFLETVRLRRADRLATRTEAPALDHRIRHSPVARMQAQVFQPFPVQISQTVRFGTGKSIDRALQILIVAAGGSIATFEPSDTACSRDGRCFRTACVRCWFGWNVTPISANLDRPWK
jgi:hypothetical protein